MHRSRPRGQWPPGEQWRHDQSWPPDAGHAWPGIRRRLVRGFLAVVLMVLVVPVTVALVLAGSVGGTTAVLVVIIVWIAIVLIVLVASRLAFRALAPIRELVETTDRLAEGDYAARVEAAGSAPMQPVITSLNTLAERLEASDELRRRLLADVGHELRTPLTLVRGGLEAMADGVRPIDADELRTLLADVGVMERLLDDLRTLSAAEAGVLQLHREPTDMRDLVYDVAAALRPIAGEKQVELSVDASAAVEPIDVDPVRMREVIANLLTNALRATAEGDSIAVAVAIDGNEMTVTVSDDGVGMSEAEREHAFDRFHRGPTSHGSGLGLTISRDLVEAHGGEIRLTSTAGEGTTVSMRLPTTG